MTIWYANSGLQMGDGRPNGIGVPWGLLQLYDGAGRPGVALSAMQKGDTLILFGSVYQFVGEALPSNSYQYGIITPAATDCTIRSAQGEIATLQLLSGLTPLCGTYRRGGFIAHRTTFLGLRCQEIASKTGSLIDIRGLDSNLVADCVVAHCECIGVDIGFLGSSGGVDNHEGILFTSATGGRAFKNISRNFSSTEGNRNSAGGKIYRSFNIRWEDNWFHHNNVGFFAKDHGVILRVLRNLSEENINPKSGGRLDFVGTIQNQSSDQEWADNVSDGALYTDTDTVDAKVHNNLFRDSTMIVRHERGSPATNINSSYDLWVYDNILCSPTDAVNPYQSPSATFAASPTDISFLDYNLIVSKTGGTPTLNYPWSDGMKSLATLRGLGHETNTRLPSGGLGAIFSDTTNFVLTTSATDAGGSFNPRTMGRYGGIVGPGSSVIPVSPYGPDPYAGMVVTPAIVQDTTRYGPLALITLEAGGGGAPAATSYTLSGPATGSVGVQTGDFYVVPNGTFTGTVTPSDGGAGGAFSPAALSWANEAVPKTFAYTPAVSGSLTISVTNTGGLPDPDAVSLEVAAPPPAEAQILMIPCGGGLVFFVEV